MPCGVRAGAPVCPPLCSAQRERSRCRVAHARCRAARTWRAAPPLPRQRPAVLSVVRCVADGGDGPSNSAPPAPPRTPASVARRAWGVAWRLLRRFWRLLLLIYACLTFNLPLLLFWAANQQAPVGDVPVKKSDEEWRELLSADAYHVLIERGTERAFSSPLEHEERPGQFACAGCGAPLFDAAAKYDSGTGWPSFFQALPGAVAQTIQPLYCLGDFGARECRCARCGGHLGHVFSDGPKPTGKRFCMNGVALAFTPAQA